MPARKKEETAEEAKELLQPEEQKAPEEPEEQKEPEKPEEQKAPEKQAEPEKKTGRLVATRPILYQGRQFQTGEQLPNYDSLMVEAWIKYGSARFE